MLNFLRLSTLVLLLVTSCIYTFSGGIPAKYRDVYIESLKNNTERQDLTINIQDYFIDEIQRDGRLNIVSLSRAKMKIIPSLLDFKKHASEFTETGEITVYTVSIKAKILTETIKDTGLFLKDTIFFGRGVYSALSESEELGVKRAITDLVNNFLNKLFEAKI